MIKYLQHTIFDLAGLVLLIVACLVLIVVSPIYNIWHHDEEATVLARLVERVVEYLNRPM